MRYAANNTCRGFFCFHCYDRMNPMQKNSRIKDIAREVKRQVNFVEQCRRHNLSIWECPQFLFMMMGALIVAVIIVIYILGSRYLIDPEVIIIALSAVTVVLFIISFVITQSFERLAEASRMKTEFINIISHQIRTPLTSLRWMHDSLSGDEDNLTEAQRRTLKDMHGSIKRMIKIASDLLIASRIERGKLVLKKERYSLEETVRRAMDESDVSTVLKVEGDIPFLNGDEFHVRSAIVNLLDNASKYGGDKVEAEIKRGDDKVVLIVRDNGPGISEEDREKLFQKFFRGKDAPKYSNQGIGLGLFVAKSIVEKEGGSIGFDSNKSLGTEFRISLPIQPY